MEDEQQAIGAALENSLGLRGVDLTVVLAHPREYGAGHLVRSALCDKFGVSINIDVTAVAQTEGDRVYYALSIRNIDRRLPADETGPSMMPRAM